MASYCPCLEISQRQNHTTTYLYSIHIFNLLLQDINGLWPRFILGNWFYKSLEMSGDVMQMHGQRISRLNLKQSKSSG